MKISIKELKITELKIAEDTPESECFDCKDWARIGRVCPAHAELRKKRWTK